MNILARTNDLLISHSDDHIRYDSDSEPENRKSMDPAIYWGVFFVGIDGLSGPVLSILTDANAESLVDIPALVATIFRRVCSTLTSV